jgi:hypothetical protein
VVARAKVKTLEIFTVGLELEISGDTFRKNKENVKAIEQYEKAIKEYNKLVNNPHFPRSMYDGAIERTSTKIENARKGIDI